MAKAFDSVNLQVAAAALERGGTPPSVIALLQAAWTGPRYCHVEGELAERIDPCRGLPPGCPASAATLAAVLAPWGGLVGDAGWAYMDDRSVKTHNKQDRAAALATTARFDAAVGLLENEKKRQVWEGNDTLEHLGLRLQGNQTTAIAALPRPRDGWEPVEEVVRRLAVLPGPADVREKLALCFIRPKWAWAAPLVEPPPARLAKDVLRAVTASRCTWWCQGRWWCDRIGLHPVLGTAVQAVRRADRFSACISPTTLACVRAHAAKLRLQVVEYSAQRGCWVRPTAAADPRAQSAARAAHRKGPRAAGLPADAFCTAHPAGEHAARVCARAVALSGIPDSRNDAEGTEAIDLEVQSHPTWRDWRKGLTAEQASRLAVWRGGAVYTPTRRWHLRGPAEACRCPFCGHDRASARHLWAECPRFDEERRLLERQHRIAPRWWREQPRCTAKTGWVVADAAPTAARRATLQVAACSLGMAIVAMTPAFRPPQSPDGEDA